MLDKTLEVLTGCFGFCFSLLLVCVLLLNLLLVQLLIGHIATVTAVYFHFNVYMTLFCQKLMGSARERKGAAAPCALALALAFLAAS